MITLSIDSSAIKAKLEQLKNIDTKPLMEQIATDMKNQVDMRFRKCEDPDGVKWPELSPATIAQRRNGSSKKNGKWASNNYWHSKRWNDY